MQGNRMIRKVFVGRSPSRGRDADKPAWPQNNPRPNDRQASRSSDVVLINVGTDSKTAQELCARVRNEWPWLSLPADRHSSLSLSDETSGPALPGLSPRL